MVADIGWVDALMLGLLLLSLLVGLWRGFVFELLSLAGWFVAWFAAQWGAEAAGARLPFGSAGALLNHAAGFVIVFIVALMVWGLSARLLQMLIKASPLSAADRVLGAGFGLLRGLLLLLAVTTVVALTPAVGSQAWTQSLGAGWLMALLEGLQPVLPQSVAQHLPA